MGKAFWLTLFGKTRGECGRKCCDFETRNEALYWCLYILDMNMGAFVGGESGDVLDRQAGAVMSFSARGCLFFITLPCLEIFRLIFLFTSPITQQSSPCMHARSAELQNQT